MLLMKKWAENRSIICFWRKSANLNVPTELNWNTAVKNNSMLNEKKYARIVITILPKQLMLI